MGFSTVQIDVKKAVEKAKKMSCFEASNAECLNGVIPWDKVTRADDGDNGKLYLTFAGAYPFPFAVFE